MRLPSRINFLYLKKTPRYPQWQPGNPVHRLFFPQFWMRLMPPNDKVKMPNDHVYFECHLEMTKPDIKQYLEKIYKVDVIDIRTLIMAGKPNKNMINGYNSAPDAERKYAYVQLVEEFKFPTHLMKPENLPSHSLQSQMQKQRNIMIKVLNKTRFCPPNSGMWF